uniref:BLTX481 n=2 Tax=Nephila pilipes TaxID=299642 RepID=A0A076KUZ3_NEPPI|nr:BLTX481 [Nephila pilipes]
MSLLSHLFVHAVNLYNYEDAIVKKFVPFSSATDICFGLTFIIVGTSLGLLLTLLFGVFQIFFMDNKNSDEDDRRENKKSDEPNCSSANTSEESESDTEETSQASKDDNSVRKRK